MIRRRDLSVGDLLLLEGRRSWWVLTQQDLEDLGDSLPGSQTHSEASEHHSDHDEHHSDHDDWEMLDPLPASPEAA